VSGGLYWRKSPQRNKVVIVFKPDGKATRGEYNQWLGFAVVPRRGWRKMRRLLHHIWRIICRCDKGKFKYLIKWLAFAVQHPDKPAETVIVLKNRKEGAGKSTLSNVMLEIFGRDRHGAVIDDGERFTGRFNDWLERGWTAYCRRNATFLATIPGQPAWALWRPVLQKTQIGCLPPRKGDVSPVPPLGGRWDTRNHCGTVACLTCLICLTFFSILVDIIKMAAPAAGVRAAEPEISPPGDFVDFGGTVRQVRQPLFYNHLRVSPMSHLPKR
jgi:hypothetical protein